MFSIDNSPSPYDVRFSIFGFPVRISWTFWLGVLFLGAQDLDTLFILVGVVFVSVLVHELGHAFAIRFYGRPASIVLHWMGGYAIEGSDGPWQDYSGGYARRRTTKQQVIISLAGPIAGLLLGAIIIAGVLLSGGKIEMGLIGKLIPFPVAFIYDLPVLNSIINYLLWFNILISFMNLVPVWPLDGGQVARAVMVAGNPYAGMHNSLQLSLFSAIVMVVIGLLILKSTFMAILFGSLAFQSYQMLTMGGGGRGHW